MATDPRAKTPKHNLTSALARRAAEAADAKARELGIETITVAVCDESGNLVFFSRGDSCSFITAETSQGKAIMAAGFRRPTLDYVEHTRQNAALWSGIARRLDLVTGEGGYPITQGGYVIGGIGCGGALAGEDHLCAEAGAKAVSS